MNLRLVVSNSCADLYSRCMQADPLLGLLGTPKLRRLLEGIPGAPPYVDFSGYWNATSRSKASVCESLEEALVRTTKNYFFAQFTKVFVSSPRIWSAVHKELDQRLNASISSLKLAFLDIYPRELAEMIQAHGLVPLADVL